MGGGEAQSAVLAAPLAPPEAVRVRALAALVLLLNGLTYVV